MTDKDEGVDPGKAGGDDPGEQTAQATPPAGSSEGAEGSPAGDAPGNVDGDVPGNVEGDGAVGSDVEDPHGVLDDPSPPVADAAGRTDWAVFGTAAVFSVAFVLWGVLGTDGLEHAAGVGLEWVVANAGWAFVLSASGFVVFALWLAFSRYGRIPLGRDDERPEFRTISWVAMMFSAGMGIGLMFFGVAEPLAHFTAPPPGSGVDPQTGEAMQTAMATTLFHWTLHPWAIYAVVGLAIAYSAFRKGRRQLISSVFAPLLGETRSEGGFGKAIDIMAIFATLFGSAASLGLGALQIGRGMQEVNWIGGEIGTTLLVIIIAVLTCAFIASAVSGVAKGIQWLSNINMVLAGVLALFLLVVGPTMLILNLLPTTVGTYLTDLAEMAARTEATGGTAMHEWLAANSVFYWAWWISWTPFVGMFIARISRGRSIREFVVGVLLVPSAVSLIWFAIFGGTAIDIEGAPGGTSIVGQGGQEAQLFGTLQEFPLAAVTSVIVMLLVAIFFVSGADAASIVMGTLSQRGSIEPKRWVVIIWGALTGAVAAIMLAVGISKAGESGDPSAALTGLQNLTVLVGLPFMLVMVCLCVALAKDLRHDPLVRREIRGSTMVEEAVVSGTEQFGADFQIAVTTNGAEVEQPRPISGERPHTAPPHRKHSASVSE